MSWDVVVVETVESANQLQYLALLSYTKRSTNYILERKQSVVCNKYIVCTSWYTIGRFFRIFDPVHTNKYILTRDQNFIKLSFLEIIIIQSYKTKFLPCRFPHFVELKWKLFTTSSVITLLATITTAGLNLYVCRFFKS